MWYHKPKTDREVLYGYRDAGTEQGQDAVIHAKELIESKRSYGLEYVIDGKEVREGIGTVMITDMAIDGIFGGRIRRNDKS